MKEKGQALVETVLILPFLLILIIGIVEGSIVLQRQLIVVNAAREGARFGAYGASADDIHVQTLLATSQMFEFTEENAVIAVIQATTNEDGTGFTEWMTNTYPVSATVPHVTRREVLEQLNEEGNAANLGLVIVDVYYNHESVFGFPLVGALADKIPIGSWTVMRIAAPNLGKQLKCCALPITLPIWEVEGLSKGDELIISLTLIEPGQFGWLYWDPDSNRDAVNLGANLKNRCNAGQKFKDACDGSRRLASGSWVLGVSGKTIAEDVKDEIGGLVGRGYYPVPIYDQFELCDPAVCDCKSGTQVVHIVGFALMEITEVKLIGDSKTISTKFHGWYEGCDD